MATRTNITDAEKALLEQAASYRTPRRPYVRPRASKPTPRPAGYFGTWGQEAPMHRRVAARLPKWNAGSGTLIASVVLFAFTSTASNPFSAAFMMGLSTWFAHKVIAGKRVGRVATGVAVMMAILGWMSIIQLATHIF
jgi:hypothetical protein